MLAMTEGFSLPAMAVGLSDIFGSNAGKTGFAGLAAQGAQTFFAAVKGASVTLDAGARLLKQFNLASGLVSAAAPLLSTAQKISPLLNRLAVPVAIASGSVKTIDHLLQGDNRSAAQTAGYMAGSLGGMIAGAEAGAALGSIVPLVGTVVGGAGGAVLGGLAGAAGGKIAGGHLYDLMAALKAHFSAAVHNAVMPDVQKTQLLIMPVSGFDQPAFG